MDNKPLDVDGEVAEVARIALDDTVLDKDGRQKFITNFIRAAGDNMARPERLEDVEHFAIRAADRLLAHPELRDTLICLIQRGLHEYMRPK